VLWDGPKQVHTEWLKMNTSLLRKANATTTTTGDNSTVFSTTFGSFPPSFADAGDDNEMIFNLFSTNGPPLAVPFSVRRRVDFYRKTLCSKIHTLGDAGGAGAEPEQSAVKTYHSIPVLEGVDEDAEAAHVTLEDELLMLVRDNPIRMKELKKYLQGEEQTQMQAERALRLTRQRQKRITMQPK